MTDDYSPFENWTPEKGDQIMALVESICEDEVDAAAHLASCLLALIPDGDSAISLVRYLYTQFALYEAESN